MYVCVCVCVRTLDLETFIYFIMFIHIITSRMLRFEVLGNMFVMSGLNIQDHKVCTDPG